MKHTIKTIILLITTSVCYSQNSYNLSFEKINSQKMFATNWSKFTKYSKVELDSLEHTKGKQSVIIKCENKVDSYGTFTHEIPTNFKGEKITIEGFIKTDNVSPNGGAGLLIKLFSDGEMMSFNNMYDRKITGTNTWKKYSITIDFSKLIEKIEVGGFLMGSGNAWFDDFKISINGKDLESLTYTEREIPKAKLDTVFNNGSKVEISNLTNLKLKNLEVLGKVWGFLKYYHPKIASGNYNWDFELFRVLPKYLEIKNVKQRNIFLTNWINNYGEIRKCTTCNEQQENIFLKPDIAWIDTSEFDEQLKSKLLHIYKNRNQEINYYISSGYVKQPKFNNENSYENLPYPDDGFRVLALFRYWNIIHYLFPYKHLTDKNWNNVLLEYLPKFINAKNELEYELSFIEIIGDVKDTHANLWKGRNKVSEFRGSNFAPFRGRFIENKFVVDDYFNPELKEESGVEIGDVITHINSEPINSIVKRLNKFYPASNQPARLRDISSDLLRSSNEKITITYVSNGASKRVTLKLYPRKKLKMYRWYRTEKNKKCYKMLPGNIGYVTLKNITREDVPIIKKLFKNTKGIIIDIRNYPSTFVPFSLGSFFVSKPTPFVKFTEPNYKNIGEFSFNEVLKIPNSESYYQGKLIVLVNEYSQSQAEYTAMAFRAGDNTTILGSTTAGADGNISTIPLPGGMTTWISGIGVYYPDGKETQRIGILPDIEVKPTIKGIKEGRDELLEKAIKIIKSKR